MALGMPRPIAHASGVYHLNIRVPSDLAAKGRAGAVAPLGFAPPRPRAPEPRAARGPAGECYRANVARFESDPEFMPDGYLRIARQFEVDVAYWRHDGDDDLGDIGQRDAVVLATLALPRGPQLLACERGCDIDEFGVVMTSDFAIADLFGAEADGLCRVRHIEVDPATRMRLIREIGTAYKLLDRKLLGNAAGTTRPTRARLASLPSCRRSPSRRRSRRRRLGRVGLASSG